MIFFVGLFSILVGLIWGPIAAVTAFACLVLSLFAISIIRELWAMIRFRREYRACAAAILANDETEVDRVNRWSSRYYVHKLVRLSASQGKIKSQTSYYIRTRRNP